MPGPQNPNMRTEFAMYASIEPFLAAGRGQLQASPREPSAMRVYTAARRRSRDYVGDVQVATPR